jgi:hypothetical protein
MVPIRYRLDDSAYKPAKFLCHPHTPMAENHLIAPGCCGVRANQNWSVLPPLPDGRDQFLKVFIITVNAVRNERTVDHLRIKIDDTALGEFFKGALDRSRGAAHHIG